MKTSLPFDDNVLAGQIPTEIAHCFRLKGLSLGENELAGESRFAIAAIDGTCFDHLLDRCCNFDTDAAGFKTFIESKVPNCTVDM